MDAANRSRAQHLLVQANQARAAVGAGPLRWDGALAAAATKHCLRMASEKALSHRYRGELDLAERAGLAEAHFSEIEENIALASNPDGLHQGWMDSPPHRANLLNPEVDSVGIAVVSSGGIFYAVADYARAVPMRSPVDVESAIARLLRDRRIVVNSDPAEARAACALDRGFAGSLTAAEPRAVFRWQDADLSHLPQPLEQSLRSHLYKRASVGSCPARDVQSGFTIYRLAVLLY